MNRAKVHRGNDARRDAADFGRAERPAKRASLAGSVSLSGKLNRPVPMPPRYNQVEPGWAIRDDGEWIAHDCRPAWYSTPHGVVAATGYCSACRAEVHHVIKELALKRRKKKADRHRASTQRT